MNYEEMFNKLDQCLPNNEQENEYTLQNQQYQPTYFDQPMMGWEEAFTGFKTTPVLYNVDGFISPYSSNNWGGTSNILQYIDDQSRLPALETNKVDPNKIFSSEINALRALAADQQKITKMFEKRLMESLTEKGKVGLTEEDVEAMSALTAARSAITSISKEQVNIKKNIADIRVKQSQLQNTSSQNGDTTSVKSGGGSATAIGRSILDNIFDAPSTRTIQTTEVDYQPENNVDPDEVLDSLVPETDPHIAHESAEPKTYVVLGDTDDDIEFVTYDSSGHVIPDFPKPTTRITKIDRNANEAIDELLVRYKILPTK